MSGKSRTGVLKPKVALILLEGDTEEEFYTRFLERFCKGAPRTIKNLKGNYNLNAKIVDAAHSFAERNPFQVFDVYVCVDQERIGVPAFNHEYCSASLRSLPSFRSLVPVVATLMCESLFFLDIAGIYNFLKTPKSMRRPHAFANFRRFTHVDLSKLFKAAGKIYKKGHKCAHFVSSLNLDKIAVAEELANLRAKVGM